MLSFLSLSLSFSWILWRCRPRTERHHRVTRVPPWLSQLRQLYLADNNRGEESDPAHLRHAGAGGRLWYCISLWRSAVAWQLKNEVRSRSVICTLIFFISKPFWCSLLLPTHHKKHLTLGQQLFYLNTLFILNWKWHQVKKEWVSDLIWLDYCKAGWIV